MRVLVVAVRADPCHLQLKRLVLGVIVHFVDAADNAISALLEWMRSFEPECLHCGSL